MRLLEDEWESATSWDQRDLVASIASYALVVFCGSFCGNEAFLVDLHGLWKYLKELSDGSTSLKGLSWIGFKF